MNEQKLNEKLAKWAGFNGRYIHHYKVGGAIGVYDGWEYPDGRHRLTLPRFTTSLDSCFKRLVPKLQSEGYGILLCDSQGKPPFLGEIYDERGEREKQVAIANHENPALALCLAIEKLIDPELTGKEVLEMK